MDPPQPSRRAAVLALKLLVLAAVVWGVWRTIQEGWEGLGEQQWSVSWGWLVASGAIYATGLLPAAWYWRRAMMALGGRPDWTDALPAYFAGHLAKYVPGKVLVVALRAGMLPRHAVPLRVAMISVFLETFTTMAVGAAWAVALAPLVLELSRSELAGALSLVVMIGLPTWPPLARRLVRYAARLRRVDSAGPEQIDTIVEGIDLRLMFVGWCAGSLLWILFGLSLGAMIKGVEGAEVSLIGDLPLLVSSIALSMVAGFASFLPGGFGVRDVVLVGLLAPRFGDSTALIVGVGLRLVWIIAELVVYAILNVGCKYLARRRA